MRDVLEVLFLALLVSVPLRYCSAPPGWYVNGVTPDGTAELLPALGDPAADLDDARARREIADPRRLEVRIHCTGGATPRQDGRSVWCQR